MPSRTPETLTAVQRAQRLNIQRTDKLDEADKSVQLKVPMSSKTAKPLSKQEEAARKQGQATLPRLNPSANATADIDPHLDVNLSLMVLPITEIEPYEHNPRTSANPNYEQIKESIKADGITNMLTVTRRNKLSKYTTYGGGNTRLQIAKELYASGDERFAKLQVVFKTWPGDAQVITAHLVENENRADISFWEKAQGVQMFKTEFERESNKPLTAIELNRELKQRGLNYGIRTLQNFAFSVEHMAPIGRWLKPTAVNELLRPKMSSLMDLAAKFGLAPAMREKLLQIMNAHAEAINDTIKANDDRPIEERVPIELNHDQLVLDMEAAGANVFGVSVDQLSAMQAALAADPRITPDALLDLSPITPEAATVQLVATSSPAVTEGVSGPTTPANTVTAPIPSTQDGDSAVPTPTPAAPTMKQAPAAGQQAPLPGMLATVPTTTAPVVPAGLREADSPLAEESLMLNIKECLRELHSCVVLHDVLLEVPDAPFGFVMDLPMRDLAHADDKPLSERHVALRAALWKVLVAISGQCDQRMVAVVMSMEADSNWRHALSQGEEVFANLLHSRTGVLFHQGAFIWQMSELAHVLADPDTGLSLIKLFNAMEMVRLHHPSRIPVGYVPLFTKEGAHG